MEALMSLFLFYWIVPLLLAYVAVLSTPLGAAICMILARKRGLNVWYYGAIGAIYTLFYLLPVVYLISRLSGRNLSQSAFSAVSFFIVD